MENMDKGLTVSKWVLINQLKISQMPHNLSGQAQAFGILMKKASLGVCSPCLGTKNSSKNKLEKPRIQNWTYFCPFQEELSSKNVGKVSPACRKEKERRIK